MYSYVKIPCERQGIVPDLENDWKLGFIERKGLRSTGFESKWLEEMVQIEKSGTGTSLGTRCEVFL